MAFGLGEIPLMGAIWAARPKPVSTLWKGVKAGAPMGAAVGYTAGGPIGAGVGAAVGTALGTITAASQRLVESMNRLETVTRRHIEQYRLYSPVIARMRHQWTLLDRRLNRIWAETLAPILKKLTDIGTEFKERWTKMKIEFFQAIEPHLLRFLDFFHKFGRITLFFTEKIVKAIGWLLTALEALAKKLNWITEETAREPTRALIGAFPMGWPTVEGPLSGAMRRTGLTGPPFTTERRRPREEPKSEADILREKGMLHGQPGEDIQWPTEELPKEIPGLTMNVNVSDSKELTAAFERMWLQAVYELREIEAEDTLRSLLLQQQGTYT